MKRVYCLYRVSTKGQVDKDDIPMQRTECHNFAERMGWSIIKEFYEKGVSGFKVSAENRDAIQDLKLAAEHKEFDILLVFMFDRLGRIQNETPFVLEWFVSNGIEVWSAKEGQQVFETDSDYLMNYIRFWQASGESRKTSIRVKTRLGQLVESGVFTGGCCPYGYKFVNSGIVNKRGKELVALEVEPQEAAIVKLIFDKTINYGYGTKRICDLLSKMGLKSHKNSDFQPNSINRILRNRLYTGYLVRGGTKSCFLEHLKIIDEEDFNRVEIILSNRNAKAKNRKAIAFTTRGEALLCGNIFCGHCGSKMYASKHSDKHILKDGTVKNYTQLTYMCPNKARNRGVCNGKSQYKANIIESYVLEAVNKVLGTIKMTDKDDSIKKRYRQEVVLKKKVYDSLQSQLKTEQKRLTTLIAEIGKALVGESNFSVDILNESIKLAKQKIEEIEKEIPKATSEYENENKLFQSLDNYYERFLGWSKEFNLASTEEKKMIICELVNKIIISEGYKVKIVFNYNYLQFIENQN